MEEGERIKYKMWGKEGVEIGEKSKKKKIIISKGEKK